MPDEIVARIREQLAKRSIETDDWDSLRRKMRQGIERRKERFRLQRLRVKSQFEPARPVPDGASTACQGVDKDGALLVLTFRYFKGQKFELAERVSFSQQSYSIQYACLKGINRKLNHLSGLASSAESVG